MDRVIIMAAGEGTRMKSNISKVLHKVVNKPLLRYVVDASEDAGIKEKIVIVGKNEEAVKSIFKDEVKYVKQEIGKGIPYGTGYAVMLANDHYNDEDNVLILSGDVPLISSSTISKLISHHERIGNDATVLTAKFEDPTGYGRIYKDDKGDFIKIVEQKDCDDSQVKIDEINSGIYIFNGKKLKDSLKKIDTENAQGELYLTDVFQVLKRDGSKIGTYMLEDNVEISGINNKVQLSEVDMIMRRKINEKLMNDGVILENPDSITIEKGVKIGRDTIIQSNTRILGDTEIGDNCFIGMNSQIVDSKIHDNVTIYSSFIEKSVIEEYTDIGPFARLRPNAHLKQKVHIGNFVEVKNSEIGNGTKAGHLAYIGDAKLGQNINVGCGVVFVNYDGKNKFRSIIEDDAFIGSNANIVAPVHVEKEGYVAAGSTITKNVKMGSLAIERANQLCIDGYVEMKKKRDAIK